MVDLSKHLEGRLPNWAIGVLGGLIALIGMSFAIWSSMPDNVKMVTLANIGFRPDVTLSTAPLAPATGVRVTAFSADNSAEMSWLKDKVERNFVDTLVDAGVTATDEWTSAQQSGPAAQSVSGSIDGSADGIVEIHAVMNGIGKPRTAVLAADYATLKDNYKSIPTTLLFEMGLSPSLKPAPTKPITRVPQAYLLFAEADRLARLQQWDEAGKRADAAIKLDTKFATATWLKGEILRRGGDEAGAVALQAHADDVDPDHLRPVLTTQIANPMPDLWRLQQAAQWASVSPGLEWRRVESPEYKLSVVAWRIDPKAQAIGVAVQPGVKGATAVDYLTGSAAQLTVNGGFFDVDPQARLSPSGLVVAGGKKLAEYAPAGGSGVFWTKGSEIGIGWSKDFQAAQGYDTVLQVGPVLVEPGGRNGINTNDYQRVDRAALCVTGGKLIVITVFGGLSLYELADLMSAPVASGGFGCDSGLNLAGGPSVQVAFAAGAEKFAHEGRWRAPNAIVVVPRTQTAASAPH